MVRQATGGEATSGAINETMNWLAISVATQPLVRQ